MHPAYWPSGDEVEGFTSPGGYRYQTGASFFLVFPRLLLNFLAHYHTIQFFQSGQPGTSSTTTAERSPKKRKVGTDADLEMADVIELMEEDDILDEDAMKQALLEDCGNSKPVSTSSVRPASNRRSTPGPSKPRSHSLANPTTDKQVAQLSNQPAIDINADAEFDINESGTIPCPICAKQLSASDNTALNAHIDFCLSKDTIKAASASAQSTSIRVGTSDGKEAGSSGTKRKPESKKSTSANGSGKHGKSGSKRVSGSGVGSKEVGKWEWRPKPAKGKQKGKE